MIRGFICKLLYSIKDSIVLVASFQPFSDLRVSAFYIELVAMIARVVDEDRHAFAGTGEFHQFFHLEAKCVAYCRLIILGTVFDVLVRLIKLHKLLIVAVLSLNIIVCR